jgi:hypothetical protein
MAVGADQAAENARWFLVRQQLEWTAVLAQGQLARRGGVPEILAPESVASANAGFAAR